MEKNIESTDYEVVTEDNPTSSKHPASRVTIVPEHSKNEFIRSAWIQLACEDAPNEVFDCDFGAVTEIKHEILLNELDVEARYQASIGYDRLEPYIDYETYYEDEPYITTETYYDKNVGANRTRQVTKYKRVARQRQVTKYKTVTDWSATSGIHNTTSTVIVENLENRFLNTDLFVECSEGIKDSSIRINIEGDSDECGVNNEAFKKALQKHSSNITASVYGSLPGDHAKQLDYSTTVNSCSSTVYQTEEYSAKIEFQGKTYTKATFPIGKMVIDGDTIENPTNHSDAVKGFQKNLNNWITQRTKAVHDNVYSATKLLAISTVTVLALSIITSLFIRLLSLVIAVFALSVAFFVLSRFAITKAYGKEREKCDAEIKNETQRVENLIKNYSTDYRKKKREALDKKLVSLGLEPSRNEELSGTLGMSHDDLGIDQWG